MEIGKIIINVQKLRKFEEKPKAIFVFHPILSKGFGYPTPITITPHPSRAAGWGVEWISGQQIAAKKKGGRAFFREIEIFR